MRTMTISELIEELKNLPENSEVNVSVEHKIGKIVFFDTYPLLREDCRFVDNAVELSIKAED